MLADKPSEGESLDGWMMLRKRCRRMDWIIEEKERETESKGRRWRASKCERQEASISAGIRVDCASSIE